MFYFWFNWTMGFYWSYTLFSSRSILMHSWCFYLHCKEASMQALSIPSFHTPEKDPGYIVWGYRLSQLILGTLYLQSKLFRNTIPELWVETTLLWKQSQQTSPLYHMIDEYIQQKSKHSVTTNQLRAPGPISEFTRKVLHWDTTIYMKIKTEMSSRNTANRDNQTRSEIKMKMLPGQTLQTGKSPHGASHPLLYLVAMATLVLVFDCSWGQNRRCLSYHGD